APTPRAGARDRETHRKREDRALFLAPQVVRRWRSLAPRTRQSSDRLRSAGVRYSPPHRPLYRLARQGRFDFLTIENAKSARNSTAIAHAPICGRPAGSNMKPAAAVTTARMKKTKLSMVVLRPYSREPQVEQNACRHDPQTSEE